MRNFELYYEPRTQVSQLLDFPKGEPEMTEFESAFLCGLIKEIRPHKILEVGIAAGGTSSIILQCINLLSLNKTCEFFSVDVSELFYRGTGEPSGYLASVLKDKTNKPYNHHILLGKYLPEVIERIGNNIDFVILDTTHSMPGEILDFLTLFPYLKENACVVLHDIANNHYGASTTAFATQILMDSVSSDKIILPDDSRPHKYPNIGAFTINHQTRLYIENCFHSLLITWSYLIDPKTFDLYKNNYQKNYPDCLVSLFSDIYSLQRETLNKPKQVIQPPKLSRIKRIIIKILRKVISILEK